MNELDRFIKNYYFGMMKALAMLAGVSLNDDPIGAIHNSPHHESHPWDKIQLTKSERKGKSYSEQQELRKAKYERINHE